MIRSTIAVLAVVLASPLAAKDIRAGSIVISDPVLRVASLQARTGAGFMTISNSGTQADRLLSATSDIAAVTQLHATVREGNVMQMREQAQGIVIPAAGRVAFAPGGLHVMFIGIKAPVAPGQMVNVRLTFEKAGAVDLALPVHTAASANAH